MKVAIKEKKAELQNKEEYFSELQSLSNKLKDYSSELSKTDAALPAAPGIPDLLNFIGKISSQNGLILQKVNLDSVSPLEEESKILKVSMYLTLSGSYPAFKNFLSSLQKNARLVEVESASFLTPAEGEIIPFDLKIKAYSY